MRRWDSRAERARVQQRAERSVRQAETTWHWQVSWAGAVAGGGLRRREGEAAEGAS